MNARTLLGVAACVLALVAVLALGGCGVGAGSGAAGVHVLVTRDFGATPVDRANAGTVPSSDTVMRVLQRHFKVKTRYGGGFVAAIDGLENGQEGSRPVDWFYYVNGIEAGRGAAERRVASGDRIWWDFHDWGSAMQVPAVVGSFPEPFRSGVAGKKLPVRVDCAPGMTATCDEVVKRLVVAGVKQASPAGLGQQAGPDVLRLLVGPWSAVRADRAAQSIDRGPAASGVFARFSKDARSLELLDARGAVARTLGAGSGLIAATQIAEQQPVWVVTGTDAAGAAAAAGALIEDVLRNHFAVAIEQGHSVPLPVPQPGEPAQR